MLIRFSDILASRIERLARWYAPVTLADVRAAVDGRPLPSRAVLVTFDDAYASVVQTASQ